MSDLPSNRVWEQQNHIFSGKKLHLHVQWRKISAGDNTLRSSCSKWLSNFCQMNAHWIYSVKTKHKLGWQSTALLRHAYFLKELWESLWKFQLDWNSNLHCSEWHHEFTELLNRIGCFHLSFPESTLEKKRKKQINSIENVHLYVVILWSACIFLHNHIVINIFHWRAKVSNPFIFPDQWIFRKMNWVRFT